MEQPLKALLIEDSEDDAILLEEVLRSGGFDISVCRVETGSQMKDALIQQQWDFILADYVMPCFSALEALELVKELHIDLPFIIVSGKVEEETAVEALKAGAHDFVKKDNFARLIPAISRELEEVEVRKQHRLSEKARRESEERYRHLAESITDIFFALDKELKCVYWNRTIEMFTGITAKHALGKTFAELFQDILDTPTETILLQTLHTNTSTSFLKELLYKGENRYFEWYVYPGSMGLAIIARDITERKRAEELQRVHKEMEKKLEQERELQRLGQLISGVAHEVRNPLNSICAVTETLFMELENKPQYQVFMRHIDTHVNRLTNLMEDLLDLGKPIEQSKIQTLLCKKFLIESIELWKSGTSTNKAVVTVHCEDGCEQLHIRVEKYRLQQVLFNLLDNAAQHMEPQSRITITLTRNDSFMIIQVIDSGSGVNPEHLPRLFDPFFSTRRKGTGLGLAIVKHIVTVHGGTIEIRNNPQPPGATAEIQLPLTEYFPDDDPL